MGAVRADIPRVVVTGGARAPAYFRGERIGAGTAVWRLWDSRRAGEGSDAEWRGLEARPRGGPGAPQTPGTPAPPGPIGPRPRPVIPRPGPPPPRRPPPLPPGP